MSTSGTVGQTVIEVVTLIEHIARRCGVESGRLTPEGMRIIKNVMYFFMTSLSNRGINLWRVQRGLFGLNQGQATYVMPAGTLDLIQAHYRMPQRLSGTISSSAGGTVANLDDADPSTVFTQSAPGGNVQWDFTSDAMVNLVGLLAASSATLNLIFEASADGVVWEELRTPAATAMTDRKWKWFNIEPAKSRRFFRVRETGSGVLSFRDVLLCQDWEEIQMYRMDRDEYGGLPEKRFPGEPRQFWFDRQSPTPQMILWPVPDAASEYHLVSVYLHMQCQDIGQLSGEVDIPQRWYDAFVANCAYSAILDLPGADLNRFQMLERQADRAMQAAESEERDNTPTKLLPNISGYTS